MSIIDKILAILAPYDCLGCGAEGALLCGRCLSKLPQSPMQCYRCRQPSPSYRTCLACRASSGLDYVRAATIYGGVAKELVWQLKSAGAQAAAATMAELMTPMLNGVRKNTVIVPVPTAANRIRQRGYDQSELLVRELSRRIKLPVARCLVRQGRADQIGASASQRRQQLRGTFRAKHFDQLRGLNVILVDDVVTTGSTLEAAAQALREAGAGNIVAITFAQPLKLHK